MPEDGLNTFSSSQYEDDFSDSELSRIILEEINNIKNEFNQQKGFLNGQRPGFTEILRVFL